MNGYQPKKKKRSKPPKSGTRVHPPDSLADKRRYMANQRIQPVEAVVLRPETSPRLEGLYCEFVAWMNYKKVNSSEFRYLYKRYYNEFVGGL